MFVSFKCSSNVPAVCFACSHIFRSHPPLVLHSAVPWKFHSLPLTSRIHRQAIACLSIAPPCWVLHIFSVQCSNSTLCCYSQTLYLFHADCEEAISWTYIYCQLGSYTACLIRLISFLIFQSLLVVSNYFLQ